jgi:RND family efflux transporter MFP subunit
MKSDNRKKNLKQIGFSLAAICLALGISILLFYTKPAANRSSNPQELPLVETVIAKKKSISAIVKAQGQVGPSHSLRLVAGINGKIIYAHEQFIDGGAIKKGETLVRIDPKEYELILAQKRSVLAGAKLNLAVEKAQNEVAKSEFLRRKNSAKLSDNAKALANRTYYLKKAQAEYEAALAEVERAQLDLKKTVVLAPINAMVAKTSVNVGEYIFAQSEIANLYGTDEFRVEVSVPVADLAHIEFAGTMNGLGSKAIVSQLSTNGAEITKEGVVLKLLPDLGPLGHMARILVVISDPFGMGNKNLPLLAKAKVSVIIEGKKLADVFAIPRSALINDNSIFIVDDESKISLMMPTIIRRERDFVYATDNELQNKQIVISKTNDTKVGQKVRFATAG